MTTSGNVARPTTVELTSKKWKIITLLSVLAIILGIVLMASGTAGGGASSFGGLLIFIALIGLLIAKVGAWWNNR